jgi:hypothetical protein
MSNHEPVHSHRRLKEGSNKTFGLTFAGVFLFIGLWPFLRHDQSPRSWAIVVSIIFFALSIFASHYLTHLNRLWFKLGLALHALVSPLIMGFLFFVAVTPMGIIMRLLGKDLLRLRRNNSQTYWLERNPKGPASGSLKNQY